MAQHFTSEREEEVMVKHYRVSREGVDFTGGFFKFIKNHDAVNLTKKNELDAGLDLHAAESLEIKPFSRALVSTDIAVEILPGYVGLVKARSGLAVNYGIMVGAGVIDSGYRGEVKVLLFNMGETTFEIKKGDRIAQLLTVQCNLGTYQQVEYLSGSERGANGFGSSGN
jgi:dUTP pyrophosphatase